MIVGSQRGGNYLKSYHVNIGKFSLFMHTDMKAESRLRAEVDSRINAPNPATLALPIESESSRVRSPFIAVIRISCKNVAN